MATSSSDIDVNELTHLFKDKQHPDRRVILINSGIADLSDDEIIELVGNDDVSAKSSTAQFIIKALTAPVIGAGSAYATFGTIAMLYGVDGLWLIGPVGGGALLCLTDVVIEKLAEKYSDNGLLQGMAKVSKYAIKGGLSLSANFGFAWGMFKTFGILIGGLEYAQNDYAKIVSPVLAVLPGIMSAYVRFKDATNQVMDRGWMRHVAKFLRGAVSTSFINQFILQGLLAPDSPIPIILLSIAAITALVSSLGQESFPVASILLMSLVSILGENISLAMNFFAFPNDIYAAVNEWMIPEWFFYGNMGVSAAFLLLLTAATMMATGKKVQVARSQGSDEVVIDSINEEDFSDSQFESNSRLLKGHGLFHSDGELNSDSSDEEDVRAKFDYLDLA